MNCRCNGQSKYWWVTTKDGIEIYYKDWGSGQPIVFSHGWPHLADDGDAQMLFFVGKGFRVIANNLGMRLTSGLDGLGLAYMPEDQVLPYVAEGRLVRVLEDWCPHFPGYHLYYPSRRHPSPALSLLVDVLRYRG